MGFERWKYQFEGAWTDPENLESRSGVYVIWSKSSNEEWKVLDVGESHDVKNRVINHDRKSCWDRHNSGEIFYSATYTRGLQQAGRMKIERQIRAETNPPCGKM